MRNEYEVKIFQRDGGIQTCSIAAEELSSFNNLTGVLDKPEQQAAEFTKQRYFNLRDLAWHILIKSGVNSLPVDLEAIAAALGYTLLSYTKHAEAVAIIDKLGLRYQRQGFSLDLLGRGIVCYAEIENVGRERFTIAHEIGHLAMHHAAAPAVEYEKEANMLSRRLLCPMGLLKACKVTSAAEVSALCGVSMQAAENSYKRYAMLLDRGKFFVSPLERQLVAQFKEFIGKYLASK